MSVKNSAVPPFLQGGGLMGSLIREFKWDDSPLGPIGDWPASLLSAVGICVQSNFPIAIYWGTDLTLIYNDAWSPIPGSKHPAALGKPAREVWPEIWDEIEPQFIKAFNGEPGGSQDALLLMERHGYVEECYFDFTFTPVYGSAGTVSGIFNAVIETTYRIINERRSSFLNTLALEVTAATELESAVTITAKAISRISADLPFVKFFTADSVAIPGCRDEVEVAGLPFAEVKATGRAFLIDEFGQLAKVEDHWGVIIKQACLVPLISTNGTISGFMLTGVNTRRVLDKDYKNFIDSVAGIISTQLNTLALIEQERQRAAKLMELDLAKTTFFSNISHEFRTPLTLLVGPLEELLAQEQLHTQDQNLLETAHRNALRLQKLVNTLLDFSRIESGRVKGAFSKVDVNLITGDLVSTFRSAAERAGLRLEFQASGNLDNVWLDVDMWEKIVLNLLSNAFKYTLHGSIDVLLTGNKDELLLAVKDTGAGIQPGDIEKIFDRFYRASHSVGRSQEGTGIGLAFVRELVKMHHGSITVTSEPGSGSIFTVVVPKGNSHIDTASIYHTAERPSNNLSQAYVQEAIKWLPYQGTAINNLAVETDRRAGRPCVLLVDDNADMREYLIRLLQIHYHTIAAQNGVVAFELLLKYKPDLLLTDIMMPGTDGLELLKKVRANNELAFIPVILLSARAGEEARVEGLAAGADDYLVKPFSASELLVRIAGHIRNNRVRRETELQFYQLFKEAPAIINIFRGPEHVYEFFHPANKQFFGDVDYTGMRIIDAIPEVEAQGFISLLDRVYTEGITIRQNESQVRFNVNDGEPKDFYFNFVYQPWYDLQGRIQGVMNCAVDVTEQTIVKNLLKESEGDFRTMASAVPQLVWVAGSDGIVTYYNERIAEYAGAEKLPDGRWQWSGLIHPDDKENTTAAWTHAMESGTPYECEHRIMMRDGRYRWHLSRALPHYDAAGGVAKWYGTATDIHIAKEQADLLEIQVKARTQELSVLNKSLKTSNDDLQNFAHVASHDLKEPLRKIITFGDRLRDEFSSMLPEKANGYLNKVHHSADRMLAMIDGVLKYSRLNSEEHGIQTVDINDLVADIKNDLEIMVAQKQAQIVVERLPVIEGIQVLLYQLFYNLLNNSLKFSKAGVKPLVRMFSVLQNHQQSPIVEIHVVDNGIGFENEYALKIFDTFTRLNSKDKYDGTGLGLSLCMKIAERHGGTITAIGIPGIGSTFVVKLPVTYKPFKQNASS